MKVLLNVKDILSLETNASQRGETIRTLLVAFNEFQRERCVVTKQIRDSTFAAYVGRYRFFIEYFQRKQIKYLSQIKMQTQKWSASQRVKDDGVNNNRADQDVVYLRAFFHWLQDKGKLDFEP